MSAASFSTSLHKLRHITTTVESGGESFRSSSPDPQAYERFNYIHILQTWS